MTLLLFAFCAAGVPATAQKSPVPVIDVHAHLVPGPRLSFYKAIDAAIRTMDRFGVARSIFMSPPRPRDFKQNYDYPDFLKVLKLHRSRFDFAAGGGTLNPMLHKHGIPSKVTKKVRANFAKVARQAVEAGAVGFGEMSSLHVSLSRNHGYSYVPADHPLLKLLADIAAERDVPFDLHMDGVASEMPPPQRLANLPNNPKKFPATLGSLDRLLSHNPKAKIIWAHGGADHLGDFSPATIRSLMEKHPNLFVSLKVAGPKAPTRNKLFTGKKLSQAWLALLLRHSERFVIGTDNFYTGPDAQRGSAVSEFAKNNVPKLQATVRFLSLLPPGLARKIGSENAIRIYRLPAVAIVPSSPSRQMTPSRDSPKKTGLCRDGNMAHCKIACQKGFKKACAKLKRGG